MALSDHPPAPPGRPLRLLHASDLHLERVASGLREVPDHLRERVLDCSYAAARRVLETAIAENVHAVLLAGDVVDLSLAGPRAIVFLREQFDVLAAEGIDVYWAGGRVDPPHAWPRVAPLPANVHVFPVEHVQHFDLHQDGCVVARVAGVSSSGDAQPSLSRFVPHPDGVPTIGVTYGEYRQANLADQLVPYMALGGRHERKSLATGDRTRMLHYPGSPQGASPDECGPHGATLVGFHPDGTISTQPVATDVIRWETHHVEVDHSTEPAELERRLVAHAESLRSAAPTGDTFVRWQVTGSGPSVDLLRSGAPRRALVENLRARFGRERPFIWTVELEVRRTGTVAAVHLDEETILGDVLREIQKLQDEPAEALELLSYVAAADRGGPIAERLTILSPEDRHEVLEHTREDCAAILSGRGVAVAIETITAHAG